MNKKRIWISVMLSILMILISVVSFATGKKESGTTGAPSNFNASGYPIVNTPITLKVLFFANQLQKDMGDLPMFGKLEKKTNVHIEWEMVRSGYEEKKSVILTSGDLPEVIIGNAITDGDITSHLGFFVPLEGYISKYCPNIQEMFKNEPALRRIAMFPPEGHIYGLPNRMPLRPDSVNVFMINKVWLDKLGLQMPNTLDDFYTVLKAFKEKDPNGNGIADEVPFHFAGSFYPSIWSWDTFSGRVLIGAYGIMDDETNLLVVDNGKVSFLPAREEYKSLVAYLNKLYREGLINQEVFTEDFTKWVSIGMNPDVPVVGATLGWAISTMVGDKWASQYVVLPPLRAPGVTKPLWTGNKPLLKYAYNRAVLTSKNQHIPETMRWLDELYSPDMSIQVYFGSEGIGVKNLGNGAWEVLPPADPKVDQDAWKWTNAMSDSGPIYVSPGQDAKIKPAPFYKERLELDSIYSPYLPSEKDIYPIVKFSKEDLDELAILKADMFKITNEKYAEWITKGGIESQWGGYLVELKKIGLDRMMSIYQKYYDDFYSK